MEVVNSGSQAAQELFDFVNNSFYYENTLVRTYLLDDEVWFCGKDIATILGFKDTDQALRKNVDNDDKSALDALLNSDTNPVYQTGIENYNKIDLKVIYINESGLYSLVLRSKIKSAEAFRKYVTKELLPSIRKACVNKYKTELEETKKKNLGLTSQIKSRNIHEPNGWIYIATNKQYSADNHYRLGKTINLERRIQQYNIGRTNKDKLYYVYTREVSMVDPLELTLRTLLKEFRESPREDMYILEWTLLKRFLDSTCDEWNIIISNKNKLILDNLEQEFKQEIPEELFIELEDPTAELIEEKETPAEAPVLEEKYSDMFLEWFQKNFRADDDSCMITMKRIFTKFKRSDEYNALKMIERSKLKRGLLKDLLISTDIEFHARIRQGRNDCICSVFIGYTEI